MEKSTVVTVSNVSKTFYPGSGAGTIKSVFTGFLGAKYKNNSAKKSHKALQGITLEVKKGEFFGIVGRNGSGKSTLLKMLAGIYQPNEGSIDIKGKLVPFIELGVGFNPELTGRENVYLNGALLGFSVGEVDDMYENIVDFAELQDFMDQKLKNYSSGMQVRLAFSMATRAKADVLLIDEVLAVGDADFQKKCFEHFRKLKRDKKTVIFVSHDMNAIRDFCDRAALIEKSKVISVGNAQKVSTMYSKLFVESKEKENEADEVLDSLRHGNGKAEIMSVKCSVGNRGKSLIIKSSIKANTGIKNPTIGFTLKDTFYRPVCGSNTKILELKTGSMVSGEIKTYEFEVDNIFNKGDYTIDFAVENEDSTEVYDWWEESTRINLDKDTSTAFLVSPNVQARIQDT